MSCKCKYQLIISNCPYYCCKAQEDCPPIACPNNIDECLVYKKMNNNCENRN